MIAIRTVGKRGTAGSGRSPGIGPGSCVVALAIFLTPGRCGRANFGVRPPAFGYGSPAPSALKLKITSWTPSSLVNATLAIADTPIPWDDSSIIWAVASPPTQCPDE